MSFVGICLIFLQSLILNIYADCFIEIASSGTITSPNYPYYYYDIERTYSIRSPSGRPVILAFSDFVVGNNDCNEYVQIQDGYGAHPKTFCGDKPPVSVVASTGVIIVKVHSNCCQRKRFKAIYNDSQGFSNDRMILSGNLSSPNYPKDYNNNLDCTYTIKSPTGRPITLVFLDFEVGGQNYFYPYNYDDYVQLQDGDDGQVRRLVCGYTLPDPFVALSGVLIVKFHTSNYGRHKGFAGLYNDSLDCVKFTKAGNTKVTSPGYPQNHSYSTLWLYCIHSDQGLQMKLTFTSFHLKLSYPCKDDRLFVKYSIEETATLHGPFCGNDLPVLPIVKTGIIFIIFVSDQPTTHTGFSAYVDHALDCSGHLNVSHGVIQSPYYPNYQYVYDIKDCTYQLSNVHSYSINLTFTDFQLNCEYEYVDIPTFDGNAEKLCGNRYVPFNRTISSGSKVVYHCSYLYKSKGFYAVFNEIAEHKHPEMTSEQTSTPLVATSLAKETESTVYETSSETAAKITTKARSEATSTSETNTPLLLEGKKEGKSSVPIVTGTVIGFVVLTIIIILLILWYLRRKTASRKPLQTGFSNENYNIHYNNGPATESCSYSNGDTGYSNVKNGRCMINTIDQNYDFATAIPKWQKGSTNDDYEDQEGQYIDQEDSYNILNVHPAKSGTTEIYDRSTEGVYDSAKSENNDMDIGLYDHTPNSPDHEYDSTVIIKQNVDDVYN